MTSPHHIAPAMRITDWCAPLLQHSLSLLPPLLSSLLTATQGWRLFDWSAWQQPWDVPWGPSTIASTMAIWVATFAGSAFLVMPAAYTAIVGKPLWELSPAGQADFALWSEFVQTFITFGIIAGVVSK